MLRNNIGNCLGFYIRRQLIKPVGETEKPVPKHKAVDPSGRA